MMLAMHFDRFLRMLQVLRAACFSVYAIVAAGIGMGALPWTSALVLLSLPMVSIAQTF